MFYSYQGKHHQYHILQEKQITMNKEIFLKAMAIYAILATFGWIFYSAKYDEAKTEIVFDKIAINAVDNYINKTADTGEMDDFLESKEGRTYVKYSK